jgi:tetratricopeptide (TPR) repeat protein
MLKKWGGEGADIDMDVYTEISKMARGSPDHADARTRRAVPHWRDADYQVLRNGDHAVIWFGNREGWDYAPFLFCRTPTGWKFDIVYQRRLVVMREAPNWVIEQGDYPYVALLDVAPQSTGKDLPLYAGDLYSCRDDEELAAQIRELRRDLEDSPNDVGTLMLLTRLNVVTGRRPRHVVPLLDRLKKLAPGNPDVYRYAAIYNVNTFFQYRTALKDMRRFVDLRPDDAFGHNFIGFLHYRLGDYQASITALERAVALQPDNVYAYALMARDYALLYQKTKNAKYREQSLAMLKEADMAPTPNATRVARLRRWLDRRLN